MQHSNKIRKFGREKDQREALLRGLAVSLIRDDKIKTTEAKAKELRPYIERLITHGKKNSLAARRLVASRLGEPADITIKKLFEEIAPRYTDRNGGYTRIIKMGRTNAGRDEAVIEFVK